MLILVGLGNLARFLQVKLAELVSYNSLSSTF
jgi:hypothetical protein